MVSSARREAETILADADRAADDRLDKSQIDARQLIEQAESDLVVAKNDAAKLLEQTHLEIAARRKSTSDEISKLLEDARLSHAQA
ncbi:MAG: hypothetical protein LBP35_02355 [Candidatus Ancillula trichonymphae]|jgi:hypothetical protein|nr:hypothetical protein [Candidatus Ancillula trichonymphae]